MNTNYFLNRILNNKLKLSVLLAFIFIPVIGVFASFKIVLMNHYISETTYFLRKGYFSFLAASDNFNGALFEIIVWFLPLFLLLIFCDMFVEDFQTGVKNILVSKVGLKKYYFNSIFFSIKAGFILPFVSLILNLLMVNIIFARGINNNTDISGEPAFFQFCYSHMTITNIIYILIFAILASILSGAITSIALMTKSRRIAYPISVFIWTVPNFIRRSIVYSLQPFTEYDLMYSLSTVLGLIALCILIIIAGYLKEVKFAKV